MKVAIGFGIGIFVMLVVLWLIGGYWLGLDSGLWKWWHR